MSRPAAIVLGAGIAGLASAIALREAGWSVELFDRASELRPIGAALSLWPNAMAGLRRLDAAARIEVEAAPIARMLLRTRGGAVLLDRRTADAFLPTRALLQAALLERLGDAPLRFGREAVATASAEREEVRFADGTSCSADLVVVADGLRSRIAGELLGGAPAYAGYAGVVALSDPVGGPDDAGVAAEYWGRHERFGLCDLGGGRRYWFHMHTAPAGAPAPTRVEVMTRAEGWPVAVRAAVAATPPERLIHWPIHAKPAPRRLGRGRVLCVGDAGHAMEPNLGQGACQAIEDAVALGVAARGGPDGLLPAFEAMRLARAGTVVRRSAEGGWAVHGGAATRTAMRAGMWLMPDGIKERMVAGLQTMPDY